MKTLKLVRKTITLLSESRTQLQDITKQVRDVVLSADVKEGMVLINSLHTTCALFVNEFQQRRRDVARAVPKRHLCRA